MQFTTRYGLPIVVKADKADAMTLTSFLSSKVESVMGRIEDLLGRKANLAVSSDGKVYHPSGWLGPNNAVVIKNGTGAAHSPSIFWWGSSTNYSRVFSIGMDVTNLGELSVTAPSSARYKDEVADTAADPAGFIAALRPVLFTYRPEAPVGAGFKDAPHLGLIAEDVASAAADAGLPDSVAVLDNGEVHDYDTRSVVVALVAAVQQLQQQVDGKAQR